MEELINCPIAPRPTAHSLHGFSRRAADITEHCRGIRQPPMASGRPPLKRCEVEVTMMVPASLNGVACEPRAASVSHPPHHPHPSPNPTPRPRYCTHCPLLCTAQQPNSAHKSTCCRPINCGSCCPCAHHQPLMLGLVADRSLSAFRFVEDANQKYIRSAKRTRRRRRWPATYAPTVFVDCRCDQSTTVGTTSMHSAKLAAHSRDMLRAVSRAPVAHIPSHQLLGP
jgi:hypothetical protein